MIRLSDILRSECIATGIALADKDAALREVVRLAGQCSLLENVASDRLLEALRKREKLGSTGFGNGLAIPHCRLPEVSDFVVGAISVPDGVDFDAADGQQVRMIAFILGPESETAEHLRALSALSLSLKEEGQFKKIIASSSAEEMYQCMIQGAREDLDLKGHTNKRLIHVVVQDEGFITGILGAFESLDSASVIVFDGRNTGEYLAKVPLFAGLFNDDHIGYNKIVMATIDRGMTNEAIRRIESVTGHLDQCTNVMVVIQDLFYAAGSLQV